MRNQVLLDPWQIEPSSPSARVFVPPLGIMSWNMLFSLKQLREIQEFSTTWFIARKWGMSGLDPYLYSQPKHATLLEQNFLLHITLLSKSTRKIHKNFCCGLYKPLSSRIRASLLGHYVALTPRNVIAHCSPDL